MPTRRISDAPLLTPCRHPDHAPPGMQVFEPGRYEHTCPACGRKTPFVVEPRGMLDMIRGWSR
jgi:hypothetical protein